MEKKLGAHTAGTGDLEGSRGYFTFQNIMSTVETGRSCPEGKPVWVWDEQLWHCSAGCEQFHCSALLCLLLLLLIFNIIVVFYFFFNY